MTDIVDDGRGNVFTFNTTSVFHFWTDATGGGHYEGVLLSLDKSICVIAVDSDKGLLYVGRNDIVSVFKLNYAE